MNAAKVTALALLAGCGGADEPVEGTWSLLSEGQPAALLSVWGTAADDVWVVGGRAAPDAGPILLHYDGAAWAAVDTGETSLDLWSVFGFDDGTVYFGGSGGTVLRYRDGAFENLDTPPATSKVFGLWGTASDDLWAVGGDGGSGGFVWRFDGSTWRELDVPDDVGASGTVFKVNGRSADDVWFSCSAGAMLRWNGEAFERDDLATESVYFSVAASDELLVAVGLGGNGAGEIYEHGDGGWTESPTIDGAPVWRGAAVRGDDAFVVGEEGAVVRRGDGGWVADPPRLVSEDFHAAWIDPEGDVWVVGGLFDQPVTTDGVLIRKGRDPVPAVE